MTVAENVETLPQPRGGNYEVVRFNALRHGVLSRYAVLPWEDGAEYEALIEALTAEHSPQGPTEEHLVEELVGIIWRNRRLRQAESAAHHRALRRTTDSYQETAKAALIHVVAHDKDEINSVDDAIRATEVRTAEDRADLESDQAMTEKALALLKKPLPTAYSWAMAALRDDTRTWWEDQLAWETERLRRGPDPVSRGRRKPQAFFGERDFTLVREATARARKPAIDPRTSFRRGRRPGLAARARAI